MQRLDPTSYGEPLVQKSTATVDLIARLRSSIDGVVITPDDSRYDDVRTVVMGNFDGRPAAVVRPADDADVARIVSIVADSGAPLAGRNGGPSSPGPSSPGPSSPSPSTVPGPCAATLRIISEWSGGYQAEVEIRAGSAVLARR